MNSRTFRVLFILFSFAILLVVHGGLTFAQALDKTFSYQAVILVNGQPLPDGNHSFVFTIYDGTGTARWADSQSVHTTNGFMAAILGLNNPVPTPFPRGAVLQVKVDTTTLTPRAAISGVPYALDLSVPFSASQSESSALIGVVNSGTGGGLSGTAQGDAGVSGFSHAADHGGVEGSSDQDQGVGVLAQNSAGAGVVGLSTGNGSESVGVIGQSNASNGVGVRANSTSGTAIACNGSFRMSGGLFSVSAATVVWPGNKPATVKLDDGSKIKLFSEEAAEIYFNDYGSATLDRGRAHILLDPTFLQTVTIDSAHPLKVFVQLEGECNGIFVTNKSATSFDVVELGHGASNASFSYRVVCKRKYYENERLATEQEDMQYNRNVLNTFWGEAPTGSEASVGSKASIPNPK